LHIPKTASTFSLSIQSVCQEDWFWNALGDNWEKTASNMYPHKGCYMLPVEGFNLTCHWTCRFDHHHKPLPKLWPSSMWVTVLREPKARLVSSFLDAHFLELSLESREKVGFHDRKEMHHFYSLIKENPDIAIDLFRNYSSLPEVQGCMVKMLTGWPCNSPLDLDAKLLARAVTKLNQLRFFGIFEQYNETLNMFHRQMRPNSSRPPHPIELKHFRSSDTYGLPSDLKERLLAVPHTDVWDEALYQEAVLLFNARHREA